MTNTFRPGRYRARAPRKIGAEVRRVLAEAKTHASPQARLEAYTHARDLYRQQQAIKIATPCARLSPRRKAMITWYGGVQEVGNKKLFKGQGQVDGSVQSPA
ncbi:MAG: hypothetical protein IPH08_00010 [Rhodocyclaceae bacterium]|nr:hypothetical protein [Rhodocyclaceae bacterium]